MQLILKMKKKGFISLHVLIGIIFAIAMLFVVTKCASSFLQLGVGDKNNFNDFVKEIHMLEEKESGEREIFILLLQEGTAAVYFEPNNEEVIVNVDVKERRDFNIKLERPNKCSFEDRCICLFADPKFEEGDLVEDLGLTVNDDMAKCEKLDNDLIMNVCGVGRANEVNSYKCSNGFIIDRHLTKESSGLSYYSEHYYDFGGGLVLQLEKGNNFITMEG